MSQRYHGNRRSKRSNANFNVSAGNSVVDASHRSDMTAAITDGSLTTKADRTMALCSHEVCDNTLDNT